MYKAAHFILQGNSFSEQNLYMPSTPMVNQLVAAPELSIKKEDLTLFFTEFTKTIVSILNQNQNSGNHSNNNNNGNSNSRNLSCHMCSGLHTIPFCKVVDKYIKAGKCKRNAEGKVVLLLMGCKCV